MLLAFKAAQKISPKELRLEPLPAPPAPLRLAPWCVNCGSAASMRCSACGSSICGVPCATRTWKKHRPECRRLQAVAFGEEYAREEDRGYRLAIAAVRGDIRLMKQLHTGLSVSVAQTKFSKAADAAMRAFVDFADERHGARRLHFPLQALNVYM